MEFNEIITKLKEKFGNNLDVAKVTEMLKGHDTGKMSFAEIVEKVKGGLGDLDGDGKIESPVEEIKGKAAAVFGGMFHK